MKVRYVKLELILMKPSEVDIAMNIIDSAKKHLKEQGIDQWQTGYPDYECIKNDSMTNKGFFAVDNGNILGYLCIDFDGEPAYNNLNGTWSSDKDYVVVHRMAISENARGKNVSSQIFKLVEKMSADKGITNFRVDTDADNVKMQHILKKNGFIYRGTIWFDNSEKIAFDKQF
ncbi:GNAT family N-acetyltransferase [Candidatus Epulonipiscium fishelsonii]|uniref:GNAT family N-acetyltransferase n=1 Tax=Candidatus Epulonipiscium fishelsonii TaxID=77094 RepID=A0ACC8XBN0_9FIRM|nr:GNAT family N-acetyltransferase [Epulopiscium sp. SCG-B11WGA-EpuloA1]ONI41294.1 GNAT family N-acetyltransferase [Epulopiscium sp. SCG-B05WGA-EpuloA1]ONI47861.1 GNAT family N-acetyltransferase [Epulopiscium sp. SCG-C06WGA-EpuloA1]